MYHIERAARGRDFIENVALWDSLAGDSPLQQSAWLGTWWDHFGDDSRSYFLVARDENNIVRGILPLYAGGNRGRVLRFVGDGLACSDGLSVLCAAADARSVGNEMGAWLATHCASGEDGWSLLDLDGVIAGDIAMVALVDGLTAAHATVHAESRMHTWFKSTSDTWDTYLSALSKPRRRSTRSLANRIDETPEMSLNISENESELYRDLDAMIELHQARWNDLGQPGSYANSEFRSFIHESAIRFLQQGRLRMQTLRLHDEVIAGELQMIGTDRAITIYSTGVNMHHADLEPGRILTVATIRHAYQNSSPGIDYLRGDEAYKGHLGAKPKRIARLRVVPPTALGRIQHAAWKGAFEVQQWARKRKGSEPIVVMPSLG